MDGSASGHPLGQRLGALRPRLLVTERNGARRTCQAARGSTRARRPGQVRPTAARGAVETRQA